MNRKQNDMQVIKSHQINEWDKLIILISLTASKFNSSKYLNDDNRIIKKFKFMQISLIVAMSRKMFAFDSWLDSLKFGYHITKFRVNPFNINVKDIKKLKLFGFNTT